MHPPVRVILVTDGDAAARRSVETAAQRLGLRCISASAGNPTPLTGPELVELILSAAYDPVLVMVDDKGHPGHGPGEAAIRHICSRDEVQVLGAIAVASNTIHGQGTAVHCSVTVDGEVVPYPVNKDGLPDRHSNRLYGDTVDILEGLPIPVVVGIGDPGKMQGADCASKGYQVTTRAILEVLTRTVGSNAHP